LAKAEGLTPRVAPAVWQPGIVINEKTATVIEKKWQESLHFSPDQGLFITANI